MFDDSALKIRLYIYAPLFFGIGAFFGFHGWFWAGVLTWVAGGALTFQIAIVSIIRERRAYIESETEKLAKQIEFYKHIQSMTDEEKYIFGLTYVPQEVLVKKDKTQEVSNEFSQTWQSLPIEPWKLKTIAQATINGEGFTIRKWAGEGKILTDPEWRKLHDAMEDLGMLEPVNPDDPRQGYNWTGFGVSVMEQVVKDTL